MTGTSVARLVSSAHKMETTYTHMTGTSVARLVWSGAVYHAHYTHNTPHPQFLQSECTQAKVNAVSSKGHDTQVNGRPSASTLNSCIISQLLYRLSTLPFTLQCIDSQLFHSLSTPTPQEPRQGSSPSSPCTLYHNSPRLLPSATMLRCKNDRVVAKSVTRCWSCIHMHSSRMYLYS